MHFIFYKTTDVFIAEERLQENNIAVEVVPTPVQDKAYCGVCIKINVHDAESAKKLLIDLEYKAL